MIRAATVRDVPAMLDIYRPYILETAYTFEYEVPDPAEFAARFQKISAGFPWLVWEEDGEILGYAYGDRAFARAAYQWDADLSVYLRQDCRGRGIGRKLYEALEDRLRRQGYFVAYGIVTDANEGSCAFHRALGYRETGHLKDCGMKFGRWYGVIWFEKRLKDGLPTEPPMGWSSDTTP